MDLEDFDFSLPKELIAKRPEKKNKSKLLICKNKKIIDFKNILLEFTDEDVLIFNDTKVIPTIIKGYCNGKELKVTLLENKSQNYWKVFVKPSKKVKENEVVCNDRIILQKGVQATF